MSLIDVVKYSENYKDKWDKFIFDNSMNGTFLQSRAFLEYHKDRFCDHSLLFIKAGAVVAVCPACEVDGDNGKQFLSHMGSTFGGLVIDKNCNNISNVSEIFEAFETYIKNNNFKYVFVKNTNTIFCKDNCNLLDYFFYKNGYSNYDELSFAFDFKKWNSNDVFLNFKSKTRNLYRTSLKSELMLRRINSKEDIKNFYDILCDSLKKYDTKPVHSLEELYDLADNRIPNYVRFYGVFHQEKMVAGSMVFIINDVFHTQYLCADRDSLYLKPMDFMDGNLIILAHDEGYKFFSFGISTEDHGRYLNEGLAKYKEGFGTEYYINKSFYKHID